MLGKVKAKELARQLLEFLYVVAGLYLSADPFIGKFTFGLHSTLADYYCMLNRVITLQTGDGSEGSMSGRTTVTYYELQREQPYLAIVRYTAYAPDGYPIGVCEDMYEDTAEEFCRLERDVNKALKAGIDASIMSFYDHEIFPVISTYLN